MDEVDWSKPIQTMDGKKVRILCLDRKHGFGHPVIGLIEDVDGHEFLASWTIEGYAKWTEGTLSSKLCVINVPEEHWVNIYWDAPNKKYVTGSSYFGSKDHAISWIPKESGGVTCVATVQVK